MPASPFSGLYLSCVWYAKTLSKTVKRFELCEASVTVTIRLYLTDLNIKLDKRYCGTAETDCFSSIAGWKSKLKDVLVTKIRGMCDTDPRTGRIRRCDVLQCPRGSQLRSIGAEVVKIYSRRALTRAVTALSLSQPS